MASNRAARRRRLWLGPAATVAQHPLQPSSNEWCHVIGYGEVDGAEHGCSGRLGPPCAALAAAVQAAGGRACSACSAASGRASICVTRVQTVRPDLWSLLSVLL